MKIALLLLSMLITPFAFAKGPQDIVIKSRLDEQSSASLIKRVRTFLINNDFGDPYNQTFDTPIAIDFTKLLQDLPADTQSWIKDFQSLLRLKLFESSYSLVIEDFSYSLGNFNSELIPLSSFQDRIEYISLNYVQGLKLTASSIAFQVELARTTTGDPIKFEVNLIEPQFLVSPELMVQLPMGWQTALLPDSFLLSLHTIDLSRVFAKVVERPDLVDLKVKDMEMPQVSIRVGNRELRFDKEKIKRFIVSRKEDMKMAILDLLRARMQERFANIIKDDPQEIFLPRALTTKGKINSVFNLKSTHADGANRTLEVKVDGHFCANSSELEKDHCESAQLPTRLRRRIEDTTFEQSMQEIDNQIIQKKANIVVSISEHYINQLITAAVQSGALKLGGMNFNLGSEKAFVLAEEKGEGFNLYLDVIHKLKPSQRVLIGRSELRFPVRLKMGLRVTVENEFPHLQIKVLEVNTDEELLIKGLPKYQLVTNVNSVRFRKKVIKGIMEDIQPFHQKILVDLELKEFKGTYLEELNFSSDGKGRANAILFMNGLK